MAAKFIKSAMVGDLPLPFGAGAGKNHKQQNKTNHCTKGVVMFMNNLEVMSDPSRYWQKLYGLTVGF